MRYCKKCIIPDTRPNGLFNAAGVCFPCASREGEGSVNFDQRYHELVSYVSALARNRKRFSKWDCVIGVSGGKDSNRQALWVREKLGMSPLLVSVVYPQRQVTKNGVDNLSSLSGHGFDLLTVCPSPVLSRRLVKEAFFRFGNWCKATEMALFAGVPRVAIEKRIPIIFWGENPGYFVGDTAVQGNSIWDGSRLVHSNTLAGGDLSWFREVTGSDKVLNMYMFPSSEELAQAGVHTVFLGPAWRDFSTRVNSATALTLGLSLRDAPPSETGDVMGTSMLDEDWVIVNFLLKFYKFGFSRGTEYANELIRSGQISRDDGIYYAETYDEACDQRYIESFCAYIGVSEPIFWEVVRKFANKDLFDCSAARPRKLFRPGYGLLK